MKKRIILSILSLGLITCVSLALFGGTPKISNADCQLPEDFAKTINVSSTFQYEKMSDLYDKITLESGKDTTVDGAMVLTGVNTDSSNTISVGITFSSIISTEKLKKNFNIIEYTVLSDSFKKNADEKPEPLFESITLKLTEVENPSNYVTITNLTSRYANYVTLMRAGAPKVQEAGRNGNGSFYDGNNLLYGTTVKGSFDGAYLDKNGNEREIVANSIKYDNSENAVYAYPTEGKEVAIVRDFDDPQHMIGLDELFDGFKSEKIQASFTVNGLKAGSVKVAIFSFNGAKLYTGSSSEVIKDTKAPEVYPTNYLDGVKAEVDSSFPVFDYNSYDDIDGLGSYDYAKVYYNYGSGSQEELAIVDGRFTPTKKGTYSVIAYKTDSSGNTGKCIKEVDAVVKNSPLSINLNGSIDEEIVVGNYVKLPTAIVSGGTEGKGYNLSVYKDGNKVELDSKSRFLISKQGVYEVVYSAYDYTNHPVEFKYFVRGYFTSDPQVDFPNMPRYLANGATLELPSFKALDWYSLAGTCADAVVSVSLKKDGGEFEEIGKSYTFSEVGNYTYRITAKSVIGDYKVYQDYPITVLDAELVSDYFYKEDITITEYEDNMLFEANKTGSKLSFINPLPTNIYSLVFNISSDYNKFDSLKLTFSDSVNVGEKVTIIVKPNGKEALINLCGVDYKVSSSFIGRDFSLSFARNALYNLSEYVAKITKYDNGEDFEGFTSGYIYTDIEFGVVAGRAGLMIKKLCNHQDFAIDAEDFMGPNITIENAVRSVAYVGDVFKLPTASAYDVFTGKSSVSYLVTCKQSEMSTEVKTVSISKDNTISITDFGIYTIKIEAMDATGHKTSISQNVFAYNTTGPVITVLGEIPKQATVGQKITLPGVKAVDFFGKEVQGRVFVLKKGGEAVLIKDNEFTIDKATEYVVWYTAYDNDYNATIVKYVITAKEA